MRIQTLAGDNVSAAAGVISALIFSFSMFFSAQASAECACFCVNGDLKTMCSAVDEAQGNPALCSDYANRACPSEPGSRESASYDAPVEGATNCRDIRVFDPSRGVFTDVKACDVLDAG
jgi:hypothetical protein